MKIHIDKSQLKGLALQFFFIGCFYLPSLSAQLINEIHPQAREFERFAYNRTSFDQCPERGKIFTAEITQTDDGAYLFQYTLQDEETLEAIKQLPGQGRSLSHLEVQRLIQILDFYLDTLKDQPDAICETWNPCTIIEFDLDGDLVTDDLCNRPHLSDEGRRRVLDFLEELRFEHLPSTTLNGDTNGDGLRDVSDVVYLLSYMFLGEAPPSPIDCFPPVCPIPSELIVLENGDVNADLNRDLSDAIALLTWLFLTGKEPFPACSCSLENPATFCAVMCGDGEGCVPDGTGGRVCTSEFKDCESLIQHYDFLAMEYAKTCGPGDICAILGGHCDLGLGGCYYFVNSTLLKQEDLDALAERFVELTADFENDNCSIGGACFCPPPPPLEVKCVDGECGVQ